MSQSIVGPQSRSLKAEIIQLVEKIPEFVEPEILLQCLDTLTLGPYLQPNDSISRVTLFI
jgi:hypothetical protein